MQVDVEHFLEQQAVSTLNFISLFQFFYFSLRRLCLSRFLELHDPLYSLEPFHVEQVLAHDFSLMENAVGEWHLVLFHISFSIITIAAMSHFQINAVRMP